MLVSEKLMHENKDAKKKAKKQNTDVKITRKLGTKINGSKNKDVKIRHEN